MSKSKKSSKSARIPQPIKVKKEKTEEDRAIHSMAHYVDDRLELVKQIFGSLKTKTITNLAPEYLKEKEMEEIQELCLNELLCLSKKRLLSIINATKCPTDTESSDEDSDVEAKEEHVSLEEISSDSEIENGGGKGTKKVARTKKVNQAENKAALPGQMSVLELLELQARARAIRSQLALEPVTKIEVDSDDESEAKQTEQAAAPTKQKKSSNQISKKSQSKRAEKPTTSSKEKTLDNSKKSKEIIISKTLSETPIVSGDAESQTSKQKIKIKRNFRNSRRTEDTESAAVENSEKEKVKCIEEKPLSSSQEVKKEKRSPSPDVIPIVADPEVLSISDSSCGEEEDTKATETSVSRQPVSTQIIEETEDGEIVETELADETATEEATEKVQSQKDTIENSVDSNNVKNTESDKSQEEALKATTAVSLEDETSKHKNDVIDQVTHITLNSAVNADKPASLMPSPALNDNDGDHSDDVISIEGGDLENEMSEHLDEDASSKHSGQNAAAPLASTNEVDIVSLDSSENEDGPANGRDAESWQSRYMKSSKVHKVLAVSRLGKRVRDKLKTSKRSKKDSNSEKSSSKDEREKSSKYVSKHEDGSIDQYKELIQMSQRKS